MRTRLTAFSVLDAAAVRLTGFSTTSPTYGLRSTTPTPPASPTKSSPALTSSATASRLADKRLYIPGKSDSYPTLKPLIGGIINTKIIHAHWGDILRLTTSIKTGTVTASLMLRKLGSYPRQKGLATALRELGRLERTLSTLDWMQNPELRRREQTGLNKGEARNALARAVFFNRLGELRDRSYNNQRHRASGLNLLTAAITLWNTVYLDHAITTTGHPTARSPLTARLGTHQPHRRLHLEQPPPTQSRKTPPLTQAREL
jgi:hypothetical protein